MATPFIEDLVPIGQVAKTIGYKGNVLVDAYPGYEQSWSALTKCLIKVEGVWAPFFVISSQRHADLLDILFADLQDDKAARTIVQQEIFINAHQIAAEDGELEMEDSEWVGFVVMDTEIGQIGTIQAIRELPGQDLAIVSYLDKSISIPLAEELIVEIDLEKKVVVLNLPHGLLDL